MSRRKANVLLPIESSILWTAEQLRRNGVKEFYGYQIACEVGGMGAVRYGTLYRALRRLEQMGLLHSRWEVSLSAELNRPRRRLYEVVE